MSASAAMQEPAATEAVLVLVDALERLGARIQRDLNADASEAAAPVDSEWADTVTSLVSFTHGCLEVLDDPRVVAMLDSATQIDLAR